MCLDKVIPWNTMQWLERMNKSACPNALTYLRHAGNDTLSMMEVCQRHTLTDDILVINLEDDWWKQLLFSWWV